MKALKPLLLVTFLLGVGLPAWVGCSKDANSVVAGRSKLFQSPPEVKTAWDNTLTAVKSKQYSTALFAIQKLRMQPGMTPEQIQALDQTTAALTDEMYNAANKGDANAKKSIDDLRKATAR